MIVDGLTVLLSGQEVCSAAIRTNFDKVAVTAGLGWVSFRRRTPARPSRPHTAISANVLLCANNSADMLAFWRSFARPKPVLFAQQPTAFSFPITEGTVELKSAGVLLFPWNSSVIEGTWVTGFQITGAGKCGGRGQTVLDTNYIA